MAQGLKFAIRGIAQIVVARLLLPADYGVVAMVAPILALVQLVGDLGLGQAAIQKRDIQDQEVSALFWLGLALNLVLATLVILAAPLLSRLYHDDRVTPVAMALAALMPLSGLATQPAALLSRGLRFGLLAIADVLPAAAGLVVGVVAASHHLRYWSLVSSTAAETLVGVTLIWILSGWRPRRPLVDRSSLRMLRMGGAITGYNLANYVTTSFDNILLGVTQGRVALGLYDKGYKIITQPVTQLTAPANRIAIPLLVRLANDDGRYRRAYILIVQVLLMMSLPGILYVMIMARPLVSLLLGPQWTAMAPVIAWLCFGALASSLYSSAFWLFVSQGRAGEQLKYVVCTSVISVTSFVLGLPWGPAGVAAGAGLSFVLLSTPLTCWGAAGRGPVRRRDLAAGLAPLVLAAAPLVGVLMGLANVSTIGSPLRLAIGLPLAYGSFFAALGALPAGRRIIANAADLRLMLRPQALAPRAVGPEPSVGVPTWGPEG